jgi:hypothetical protein
LLDFKKFMALAVSLWSLNLAIALPSFVNVIKVPPRLCIYSFTVS